MSDDLVHGDEIQHFLAPDMDADVRAAIERDKLDPRQQKYMRNATTGKLIRTTEQYHRMEENRHGYVTITYNEALELHKVEEGVKKAALREALRKKRARAARKVNQRRAK